MKKQDLEEIQAKKLRTITKFAYDYVPYYHHLFDSAGTRTEDIKCMKDLQKIPFTEKEDVQRSHYQMIANGINPAECQMVTTTGSTGKPLTIFCGEAEEDYRAALWRFPPQECGLFFGESLVSINALKEQSFVKPRFSLPLLMRTGQVSLFNSVERIVEILREMKPEAIRTYPSLLRILAKHVMEKEVSRIQPKLIFSIGEMLSQERRQLVQKAFGTSINEVYSCAEFGTMAFECNEHSGLHMITEPCILEFLREGEPVGPGEEGEIVITGLYNHVMPLIRYKIGDIGIPTAERCSCGRGFPLLRKIVGRNDGFLVLPSDTIVSARNINPMEGIHGILQYQTIQERKDRFLVKVIKGEDFGENTVVQIRKVIRAGCLGQDVNIDIEIVDEIPRERTGKIRTVISRVALP